MKQIDTLFDWMDAWRHFPNYQLERRADLFFALYLPEVLEAKLGFPMRLDLAPEFPIRIGTIYPNIPTDKSYKIDYVALSGAADKAVFVELKTEGLSRRPEQDEYLLAAQKIGLASLLEGLLDIFRATNSKRKYFCLLEHLEDMGLVHIPILMKEIMARSTLQGANGASKQIEIRTTAAKSLIVYIQPTGIGPGIISLIIGFYALSRQGETFELEHLWVNPQHMGTGVGALLFEHAVRTIRSMGGSVLNIASDPHAEGFYLRMGAIRVGEVPSRPEWRTLPSLTLVIEATDPVATSSPLC